MENKNKGFRLKDVVFLAIIGVLFGLIYELWSFAYYGLAATPLKPFASDMTLGVWLMAGPLAGVLLKKAGATTIAEVLAAIVEMLLFSSWGASDLISGFVQGIGSELGFAVTGYKNWNKLGLLLSSIIATVVTFGWDYFQSGYSAYSFGLLISLLIIRFISVGFFAGFLVYQIQKMVNKSGIMG
ncbi:ECF transporter S component [Pediococcus claussenii]|uniref:ABC-type cobalt transport system, permease component family protein n=1 Tax=Pediococcus claussenii (strain ATCC BAA-344 / DSM 14800 / JCM 18046 / KCTC 3811 / LMG 21948 / P06) TaxID=701521 RepID=G8PAI7_PEDCP|nr:ECF transporter S component [Pediococcus claussenii]AEV95776.1 ABC-type cobalt transport system, permease component family protein [Pediococcus claussenii ATCC BAA-344]ANZ69280.1 ABC transporter permease [Pediococcus claussenii]ANZ71100.1 ABC transporter permease [Pediococcus claussenii]KRN20386.1 hypothetical protein IV79_GL000439 [Pediococcus claussenii]